MIHIFTSTGNKLIHHTPAIEYIKWYKKGTPISLQIAPTSRCNLNCSFCSNANRTKHEDLDLKDLEQFLVNMFYLGAKTVEWTGGGDPTMYEHINFMIKMSDKMKFEQGFITNGILLREKITKKNLNTLRWLRISMNCLDYVDSVDIPDIQGTLGFSYVMNDKTDDELLEKLDIHVKKYQPEYVRIVTNCLATSEEQNSNNLIYGKMVKSMGAPYFYQPKVFNQPENCWWCYFKPFLLHDGYVYPCSSVVLNSGADGTFHKKFRWTTMKDLPLMYENEMVSFSTDQCDHCVFNGQNALVDMILNPQMENFI